jgi:hypothetical protein
MFRFGHADLALCIAEEHRVCLELLTNLADRAAPYAALSDDFLVWCAVQNKLADKRALCRVNAAGCGLRRRATGSAGMDMFISHGCT